MSPLPTLQTPEYQCSLPSTGEMVSFRPFTVKEEKTILTMLNEAKPDIQDDSVLTPQQREQITFQLLRTLLVVVNDCVTLPSTTKIEKLTQTDLEYLLAQIRSKSVDEIATPAIQCSHCDVPNTVTVPIDKLALTKKTKEYDVCKLDDNVSVVFQPIPVHKTLEFKNRGMDINHGDGFLLYLAEGIKQIVTKDETITFSDYTDKDIVAWMETLPKKVLEQYKKYTKNLPHAYIDIKFECAKCKKKNELRLTDINSFFH